MTVMLAVRGWVVQNAGQARNPVGGSTLPLIFPAIYEYLVAPGTLQQPMQKESIFAAHGTQRCNTFEAGQGI